MSSLPSPPPPAYTDVTDAPSYDEVTTTQISCANCGFVQQVEQDEETTGSSNEGFQGDGQTATTTMITIETIEEGFKNVSSIVDENQPPIYSNIVKNKSCTNCGFKFGTPMNTPATKRNRSASAQLNNVIERIERKATVLSTNRTRYESFGENEESSPVLPWWKRIPTKLYVNLVYFLLFIVAMIITVKIIKAHRID